MITRSYCALLRRGTCDVMATPRVSQNVTPSPAAPVITEPLPALPADAAHDAVAGAAGRPALPVPLLLPVPEDDEPPEPLGASPTFPTQAPSRVAAANKTMVQQLHGAHLDGLVLSSRGSELVKQDSL